MNLCEFTAYWPGEYSNEEIETYTPIFGDEKTQWPASESYSDIIIDIERVVRINPAKDAGHVTVDLADGLAITIAMPYNDFKNVLSINGIQITSYKKWHTT